MHQEREKHNLPYRPCVGIVVFNKDGHVWAGRRVLPRGGAVLPLSSLWQMPQGGIDVGETPFQAAKRELYEETGIVSVVHMREVEDWLFYDFPDEARTSPRTCAYQGQKQKWFAFGFVGEESEISIAPISGHEAEFDQWRWMNLQDLATMVVPFKRRVYERLVNEFSGL
ncbi:RNA pyrophosphohydrolase [Bartonella sp. DGB2]|uniref:RNA pyrophosphohydrolase n=1 Tax=Bartonella sp. DGB2 TaxID=3388426 RepID=UPI00398FDC73